MLKLVFYLSFFSIILKINLYNNITHSPELISSLMEENEKNKLSDIDELMTWTHSKPISIQKRLDLTSYNENMHKLPDSPLIRKDAKRHYIPANKEWSNSIYSYNKSNLILAPHVSSLIYKLLKSYLNASPNHKPMDNIFVVREKSKEYFPKILFKGTKSMNIKVAVDMNNNTQVDSITEKNKHVKTNKYLSIFSREYKLDSNLNKSIMKYFSTNESSPGNVTARNLSLASSTNYRYSVIKTYLNKPELKHSSNSIKITSYIFNKKNMYLLKKMQEKFNLMQKKTNIVKVNLKKNSKSALSMAKIKKVRTFNLNKYRIRKSLRRAKQKNTSWRGHRHARLQAEFKREETNKFIFTLSNKSSLSFFIYMWRYLKANSLNSMSKNILLFIKLFKYMNTFSADSSIYNIESKLNSILNSELFSRKKDLIRIVQKYSELSKFIRHVFYPSTYLLNKKEGFIKLLSTSQNVLKRELYGFKPLTNLYYFKHNIMLYYFEYYKRNNNNLLPLKTIFYKVFLKKTNYSIVNLKYWNLDSQIVSDVMTTKLIDRTKKALLVFKKSLSSKPYYRVAPTISKYSSITKSTTFTWDNDFFFSTILYKPAQDKLAPSLTPCENKKVSNDHILFISNKYKNQLLLENLQNKWKIGTKLQAKGRITKRKTAQRSLTKVKYLGTLKNRLTSQFSATLSRGIAKSNLQYANNNNYSANGSFGLKISISSLQTSQKWNINSI